MIIISVHHEVGRFVFIKLQVMHIFLSSSASPVTGCLAGGPVAAGGRGGMSLSVVVGWAVCQAHIGEMVINATL